MTAATNSRVKNGILILGGTHHFETSAKNVTITPNRSTSGDDIELLSGDIIPADSKRTDTLKITAIQDWLDSTGFTVYSWAQDGNQVTFSWTPSDDDDAPTYSGTVTVEALEVGGDVNTNLDTSAEWDIVGVTTYTPAS